jgi:GPH family glycoside/pentoside/hexuronide:cation symporter
MTTVSPSPRKLSFSRIALYSMASLGLNILGITIGTWMLYFYVPPADSGRPTYIPAALFGVLMMVASLWDAVIDPFIGHWSDTLRSRWGRRRPFLMFAAPFVLLGAVLVWLPPGGSNYLVNAIYLMVVILMYHTASSLIGIPYDATLPEMAPDAKDRVGLSFWKYAFGVIGVLIGSILSGLLFSNVGPLAMGAAVGVIAVITFYLTLLGLRESERPAGEPIKAIAGIKATFQNKQFLIIFFSTLFIHMAYMMVQANFPYFVTLVLGGSESDVSLYLGGLILLMALTGPLWSLLNKKLSQRTLLNITMIGLAISFALGFFVGGVPGLPVTVQAVIFLLLVGLTLGGYFIVVYAMMGNVVDYDEMLTGRRREAIYYGTFSFANGLGIAIGTLILPLLLNEFGFTRTNPLGVRLAFIVMSVFMLIGFAIFQKYRLGDTPEETRKNMNLEN